MNSVETLGDCLVLTHWNLPGLFNKTSVCGQTQGSRNYLYLNLFI